MQYRRDYITGAAYFFTVVTFRRSRLFNQPAAQTRTGDMATAIPSTCSGQVWEHRIRDERDFNQHIDYIHYNPVKHGAVIRPVDWPYSSIHRYIRDGVISPDWGGSPVILSDSIGCE